MPGVSSPDAPFWGCKVELSLKWTPLGPKRVNTYEDEEHTPTAAILTFCAKLHNRLPLTLTPLSPCPSVCICMVLVLVLVLAEL